MPAPKIPMQKRWLFWQVLVPLLGPIMVSGIAVLLWTSGDPQLKPSLQIVLDLPPWAMIFFTLTLLGATLNELWPKLSQYPGLGSSLLMDVVAVSIYAACIVIWRHNANWSPGRPVYLVSGILLLASVILCHAAYAKSRGG